MRTLSLPFSDSGRPSVNGSPWDKARQPHAMPSGTFVPPFATISSIAFLTAFWPSAVLTSVSGVIGSVVQLKFGPLPEGVVLP